MEETKQRTPNPNDVIEAEKKHLGLNGNDKVSGFAISGGGIRSASFGLGVMQALVSNNQLEKMDYMSTVSGGGYLGSALTWALKQDKNAGTTPETFPLGKKVAPNQINNNGDSLLNFIRQHCSYLSPTKALDMISFVAVVIRSMLMSLTVYIGIFTILMTILVWALYAIVNGILPLIDGAFGTSFFIVDRTKGVLLVVGIVILLAMFIMGFIYSFSTSIKTETAIKYKYLGFIHNQKIIGLMFKISLCCLVLGTLPYIVHLVGEGIKSYMTATGSTLFGSIVGLWQYSKAKKKDESTSASSDLLIYAGAFALFYGVFLFAYSFATNHFLSVCNGTFQFINVPFFIGLIIITFVFGFFVNLNVIGPHYMWRSRLMEAFMPNKEAVEKNIWQAATEANNAVMADMCPADRPKPYHIVNTNVILANAKKVEYSGRGGDNFIISPLYCGSDATGWRTTKTFQNDTKGITLASAMATSAAALNPNAGVSGEGVTRNVVVSVLLSMLNLRLGYWTSNPKKENNVGSPNFIRPGLVTEILRNGFTEESNNLLLSDGGHFENLALYELIRRKLNLIVVSDGGADAPFNFDDLANAIEKVRVDFGARIMFREGYGTDAILPGTSGDSLFQKKYGIAKHGFAIADIKYQDGSIGTLVYVKLAMIEGLSTDVYSYKGVHPSFPHESTADQFFDEKQFEAYRELGYYVAWQMMESEAGKAIFN